MDLYVIGFDDRVWTSYWHDNEGAFSPWVQIHPETVFDHTTQTVMPCSRRPEQMDLYVIGFDNAVWTSWWHE